MTVKGKLPLGEYEIQEGGADNDWTGDFSPENIKFTVNDRSVAKVINVTFGSVENNEESTNDEKIYQVKQKTNKKQQKTGAINKTNKTSERNFWIVFVIGFILAIGILTFVTRFIKKFR